jgi:DNA polymerase lambda
MGVCQYQEEIHHRIDIKYYPINEYPYALLYFTGSDMFNRSMRLYASKLGIQLSDHGAVARRKNDSD